MVELPKTCGSSSQHMHAGKIKIFSQEDVDSSNGYDKLRKQFWNSKANEMMTDRDAKRRFKDDPLAVKGAIDSACVIHKAQLLKLDADKLQKIVRDRDEHTQFPKKIAKDIERMGSNAHRIDMAVIAVNESYRKIDQHHMGPSDPEKIKSLEHALDSNLSELKKANEAMRKTLERKRTLLQDFIDSRTSLPSQAPAESNEDEYE